MLGGALRLCFGLCRKDSQSRSHKVEVSVGGIVPGASPTPQNRDIDSALSRPLGLGESSEGQLHLWEAI